MRLHCFFLALTLFSAVLPAQLSLFTGGSFEHEVTPRWGYEFEIEHRQLLTSGRENRVLFLAAVNRLVTRRFDVTPGIRVTPYYGEDPTTVRFFTDLNYRHPLIADRVALEGRLRTQYEREFTEDLVVPEVAIRPRLGLVLALASHTELVAEFEVRYRFDVYDRVIEQRYTLGLAQEISTRVSIDAFIRIQRETDGPDPSAQPFVGCYLVYVLPDARDRDWRYRSPFGRSLLW